MRDQDLDAQVGSLVNRSAAIRENATLGTALKLLVRERSGLPVLAAGDQTVVGWLTHHDLLSAYARHREEIGGGSGS